MLVSGPLEALVVWWRARRTSLAWAPELDSLGVLLWADNLFLVCEDPVELQLRMDEVHAAFSEIGLEFYHSSLEWFGNPFFPAPDRFWLRRTGQVFARVGQLRVLGGSLDDSGSTRAMSEFRIQQAMKV